MRWNTAQIRSLHNPVLRIFRVLNFLISQFYPRLELEVEGVLVIRFHSKNNSVLNFIEEYMENDIDASLTAFSIIHFILTTIRKLRVYII